MRRFLKYIAVLIALIGTGLLFLIVFISLNLYWASPEPEAVPGTKAFSVHWRDSSLLKFKGYKHQLIGFEDHRHWWKIIDVNQTNLDNFIASNGLLAENYGMSTISEFMIKDAPDWWPKSYSEIYMVHRNSDINVLIKSKNTWYAFRFSE